MVHIYNGILLGHKKEWNFTICDNTDGPRGYYAKWHKSDRERQIPYDFTYMWNIKSKISKQTKQKQTHRYREQIEGWQMGRVWGGWVKEVKGLRSTNCSHGTVTRNIVSGIIMAMHGISWVVELLGGLLYKLYKYLYRTPENNIILNVNCNWKIKTKQKTNKKEYCQNYTAETLTEL